MSRWQWRQKFGIQNLPKKMSAPEGGKGMGGSVSGTCREENSVSDEVDEVYSVTEQLTMTGIKPDTPGK
ncbi:hypothetical protein QDX05_23350 (plasmid) [Escherichia coli]|nr:hypothetical protein [Escherichia coli]WHF75344.1 hypothetical protein QDX05_23350 [Escherichia coli]